MRERRLKALRIKPLVQLRTSMDGRQTPRVKRQAASRKPAALDRNPTVYQRLSRTRNRMAARSHASAIVSRHVNLGTRGIGHDCLVTLHSSNLL